MGQDEKRQQEPERTEELYPGVHRDWYQNGRVVCFRLTHVTFKNVDQWGDLVIQTLSQWNPDTPYLAMHDLSHAGVSLQYASLVNFEYHNIGVVPALRYAAEDFFNRHPQFRARVAVNFSLSFSGRIGKVLTSTILDSHPSIAYKTFFSRDKALTWLGASLGAAAITASVEGDS